MTDDEAVQNEEIIEESQGEELPNAPEPAESRPETAASPEKEEVQPHNQHILKQALILFDRTKPLHGLDDSSREVLENACKLDNTPFPGIKKNPVKDAKLLVTKNMEGELSADQINVLASIILFHSGKIKRKGISKLNLSPIQQREVQTLSALLRIADGLDRSDTQATSIQHIESSRNGIWIVVDGPEATTDASEAQQNARLWFKIGFPKIKIMEPEKADTKLVPFPEPMTAPGIEPVDPLAEAGRKLMRFQFAEMLRHEEGTRLGDDTEALHDMRVATRRLRSAFQVFKRAFKPGALKSYLKGVRLTGRTLGKVRDLDVFLENAASYLDGLPEDQQSSLDLLINTWSEQRQNARQDMLIYLDSEEYSTYKRKFNAFLKTPGIGNRELPKDTPAPNTVREIAPVLIYQRLAWVDSYDPYIENASFEQLHALRIEFKKLRYTLEYFQEVLGPEVELVINDLKKAQDHLGAMTDAQVVSDMLEKFIQKQDSKQSKKVKKLPPSLSGIKAYQQFQIEQRDVLLSTFPEIWADFKRPEFRQKLAQAISVL